MADDEQAEISGALSQTKKVALSLRLSDRSMAIVNDFKQAEADVFYTLQYQKQQFPVLPHNEDELFFSPLEN